MVSVVLDNLAAGVSRAEIIATYPSLKGADVDAALLYAGGKEWQLRYFE